MIDTRLRLSVLHDADGSFTDHSEAAVDYSRDPFTITLNAADDYLYIGYSKRIGATYCDVSTANTNANVMAFEYFDGDDWTALEARDLTKGLTRSGWMTWNRPADWELTEVDGSTLYWIRARPSVTHSATVVSGLNLILADDYDLQTEFPAVIEAAFIPNGETSHIKTHVAVRNQLIQDLRNRGYIKVDSEGNWSNITPWDLYDIEEVRQCATLLALSKIFFNYSDSPTDSWMSKSKAYEDKYKANLAILAPTIDADEDGTPEKTTFRVSRMSR